MSKTNVKVVFGCMTFGAEGAEQARVHDLAQCKKIIDTFASHGHKELDTARLYSLGSSEDYLRRLGVTTPTESNKHGFEIATKSFPSARHPAFPAKEKYTHEAADIHRSIEDSLKALGTKQFDLFYLHAPDRQVELKETLQAVNEAYEAGKFKRFGISNYKAEEVEQMVKIASENNWIKPSVYQGLYNAVTRSAEPELFPVLHKHNISFYAFNPLGGGLFVGAFSKDGSVESGSRFDPDRAQGQMYRKRYWNDSYFEAIETIRPVAEKHNLTLAEVALRWMMHHSELKKQHNDAVIIGASSTNHIDSNLVDMEKGPLDKEVVDAVDKAWTVVKPNAPPYHH